MITQPTQVRFFVPTTIEKLSQTTEPTLETLTGEDYLGTAIAAGGHCVNAMDGYPHRSFQADTNASASSWRVDAALSQRERVGFVLVDQHNIRDAYAAAVKEQVDIHHYSSDVFASSTNEVPTRELSGLIQKSIPRIEFPGNATEYVSLGTSEVLDIDRHSFTIELLIYQITQIAVAGGNLFLANSYLDGGSCGIIANAAGNCFYFRAKRASDGTSYSFTTACIEPVVGQWNHCVFTGEWDGDSLTVTSYLNNAEVASETKSITGDFATGDTKYIWGTEASEAQVARARYFNRVLSTSEIEDLYDGKSIATADKWGSPTDLLGDNNATSDFKTEANATTGWTGSNATLSSVTVAEGFAPKVGTYMLKCAATSQTSYTYQAFTTVVGKKYRIAAWIRDTDLTGGDCTLRAGTTAGGDELGESSAISIVDTWQYRQIEFVAVGTTTYVSVYSVDSNAAPSPYYIDAARAMKIGCVLELESSGINQGDSKWYDSSSNSLDGTITGTKYVDVPNNVDDFYLAVFGSEVNKRYWFTKFNTDGLTGLADAFVGQIVLGRVYSFDPVFKTDGYTGDYGFPGVEVYETDSGRVLAERRYDSMPSWELAFQLSDQAQFESLQEIIEVVQDRLYPFYVCFNYDSLAPVVNRVRMEGGLGWSYDFATSRYLPAIKLVRDI